MSITENQKRIYNLHLKISRSSQKKPYRLRENFETFEKEKPEEYLWLQKIDHLFTSHPQINEKLFLSAPYHLYDDEEYFSLNYYTSQAAIKAYTTYLKQISDKSPDSPFQLEFMKDSLEFLKGYCIEHHIDLVQYLKKIEQVTYIWSVHLAEHKISPYVIIGFKYFNIPIYDTIFSIPEDEREMLISELANNYRIYQNRLDNSELAKKFLIAGINIISQGIIKHLQSSTSVVK
jgi:hypothetical protein